VLLSSLITTVWTPAALAIITIIWAMLNVYDDVGDDTCTTNVFSRSYLIHFLTFFFLFFRVFFLEKLSKAKYKYTNFQREILL